MKRLTDRCGSLLMGDQRVDFESPCFDAALAAAYDARDRPRCLCRSDGVPMYIARLGDGHIVKRMPNTGSRHACDCPSYEPPAEASGLGQVLGSAISEDPSTGETTLKLDFALSKVAGRSTTPTTAVDSDTFSSNGMRLSLRALLHYLWDQAELTRWQPGFAGRRTWGTVRKQLLEAAENKIARGEALRTRLYIPEVFAVEQREAIHTRRLALWSPAAAVPGKPQQLMLLIAEVKEIAPARYGYKAVVKHVPDQAFALDEPLYRRLGRRFGPELALWGASEDVHLVLIATFSIGTVGIPVIHELSVMALTRQWLPIEDAFEKQLVERLVGDGRSFIKGLRYNLGAKSSLASATLTDCDGMAPMLFIASSSTDMQHLEVDVPSPAMWLWQRSGEQMPPLPLRGERRSAGQTAEQHH